MDLIKRPKKVQRTEKSYLDEKKYQDYAEKQFKEIYDKTDEIIKEISKTSSTYSTEETIVGTWIDGKTIYRKAFDLGLIPNTATTINYSIESDIENVIDYNGRMINMYACTLFPARADNITAELSVYSTSKIVFITLTRTLPDAWTDRNLVVVLDYTKTTNK